MAANLGMGASNPYFQSTVDNTMGDMARNYNLLTVPSQVSSMVNSGSFGNSGLQQLQDNSLLNQQKAMGDTAANMQSNNYWTGQNFNANQYQQAFNNNQTNINTTMGLLGQSNNYNNQDISNAGGIQNTPMNYWQQFSNGANGIAGQGGNSNSSTQMPGSPLLGAVGGAMLGNQVGKSMGWSSGSVPYNNQTIIPMQPGGGY
jgi:hypothetical protein